MSMVLSPFNFPVSDIVLLAPSTTRSHLDDDALLIHVRFASSAPSGEGRILLGTGRQKSVTYPECVAKAVFYWVM
jgi:hypothetical protein